MNDTECALFCTGFFSWIKYLHFPVFWVSLVFLAVLVIEVDMGFADKTGYGQNLCVGVCLRAHVHTWVRNVFAHGHSSCHPTVSQCPTWATPIKNVWTLPCKTNRNYKQIFYLTETIRLIWPIVSHVEISVMWKSLSHTYVTYMSCYNQYFCDNASKWQSLRCSCCCRSLVSSQN